MRAHGLAEIDVQRVGRDHIDPYLCELTRGSRPGSVERHGLVPHESVASS